MNLSDLLALRERATKGPWKWRIRSKRLAHVQILAGDEGGILDCYGPEQLHNADFVIALVNAFPDIVARMEAAEQCARQLERLCAYNLIEGSTPYTDACELVEAWRLTQEPK